MIQFSNRRLILIIILLVVTGLLIFRFGSWTTPGQWLTNSILPELKRQPRYTVTGLLIPHQVKLYNGLVKEIGEQYLILESRSDNNYLEADTLFKIIFDQETTFFKQVIPLSVPATYTGAISTRAEKTNATALDVGEKIMVESRDKIIGTSESSFTAETIILNKFQ